MCSSLPLVGSSIKLLVDGWMDGLMTNRSIERHRHWECYKTAVPDLWPEKSSHLLLQLLVVIVCRRIITKLHGECLCLRCQPLGLVCGWVIIPVNRLQCKLSFVDLLTVWIGDIERGRERWVKDKLRVYMILYQMKQYAWWWVTYKRVGMGNTSM